MYAWAKHHLAILECVTPLESTRVFIRDARSYVMWHTYIVKAGGSILGDGGSILGDGGRNIERNFHYIYFCHSMVSTIVFVYSD